TALGMYRSRTRTGKEKSSANAIPPMRMLMTDGTVHSTNSSSSTPSPAATYAARLGTTIGVTRRSPISAGRSSARSRSSSASPGAGEGSASSGSGGVVVMVGRIEERRDDVVSHVAVFMAEQTTPANQREWRLMIELARDWIGFIATVMALVIGWFAL